MEPARLVDELMGVARKLGIEVRVEALRVPTRSAGGLCRLKGKPTLLLDQKTSAIDRAGALAEALAQLSPPDGDLEHVYMAPEARELVDVARARALRLASGPARPSSIPPSPVRTLAHAGTGTGTGTGAGARATTGAKPGLRSTKPRTRATR